MTSISAPDQSCGTTPAPLAFVWAFGASLGVLALKCAQALLVPQFWAEDGWMLFLQQRMATWPLLFETYAGYLNFVPRLVAWLASGFSSAVAPALYAYSAVVVGAAALASLRHASARAGLPFLALLAAIAAMPVSTEVFGRLINIQWLLQFHLLGVAIACRLGYRSARPALAVPAVLVSSLTGPFAVFTLVGMAAAEGVVWLSARKAPIAPPRRSWWSAPEFLAMVGGALVQAAVIASGAAQGIPRTPGLRELGQMVQAMQSHLLFDMPLWPELFAAAIIGLAFAAISGSLNSCRTRFAAIIVCVATTQLLTTALKFSGLVGDLVPWQNGDRYFVLFRAIVWWLLLLVLLAIPRLDRRWALGGYLGLLVVFALANGPHLRQHALEDLEWRRHARCIEAGQAVRIPVHPRPWSILVPGTATGPHPCGT